MQKKKVARFVEDCNLDFQTGASIKRISVVLIRGRRSLIILLQYAALNPARIF
jgi:hypothetical protein